MTAFPMILNRSNANPSKATVATTSAGPSTGFSGFRGTTPTGPLLHCDPWVTVLTADAVMGSGEGSESFDITGGDRQATRKANVSQLRQGNTQNGRRRKTDHSGDGQDSPTSANLG